MSEFTMIEGAATAAWSVVQSSQSTTSGRIATLARWTRRAPLDEREASDEDGVLVAVLELDTRHRAAYMGVASSWQTRF